VPDAKVRDKVVRMQCLKCKRDIVITGTVTVAPAKKTAPPKFEPEWWVIADGDQQGPFLQGELIGRLKAGKLERASHAWRQGMEGWLHLEDIPDLAPYASKSLDSVLTLDPHDEDPDPRLRTAIAPPPFVPVAETKPPTGPTATVAAATAQKREVTAVFTVKARGGVTNPALKKTTVQLRNGRRTAIVVFSSSVVTLVLVAAVYALLRPRAESVVVPPPAADSLPPPAGAGLVPPTESAVPKKPKSAPVAGPTKSAQLVVKVNGMSFREESDVRPAWLTPENVKRSVTLNQDALGPCLGNDGGPRGKCAVGFRITPDGRVKNINVTPPRIGDSPLGKCLHEMFSAMRFPKFDGEFKELEISLSVTQ
jgi:hypothetical protein